MKFFTLSFWRGLQELDASNPVGGFRKYLSTIRDKLPLDLLSLQETISLHDARIRRTELDSSSNTYQIELEGSDGEGGLRLFRLTYKNIHLIRTTSDPDIGLNGPHGYGDLGYDEADITDDGKLEHRLLFSSGIEMQIIFDDFVLNYQDVA